MAAHRAVPRASRTSSATSKRWPDRLALHNDFTFGADGTAIDFDEAANRWTLRTAQGHQVTARYVVTAVGCLSTANQPGFPGADSFQGLSLHTGNWPREPVGLAGQRVAVIGTGASGIQAIPVIAGQAAHLTVFQRTAQFTIPAENGPLDEQFVALWKQNYPEWRRRARHSAAGFAYNPSITSAFEVSAAERRATFEAAWGAGGFTFPVGHLPRPVAERGGEQDRDGLRLVQDRPDRRRP